jgi:hypothetical protein
MTSREAIEAARNAARVVLADYPHLRTPEALRADGVLEDIVYVHGTRVVDGGLTGSAGRLVRAGDQALIRVRDGRVAGRRAFTIAHELGHLVLDHGTCLTIVCSDAEAETLRSSVAERAAHAFAAELLMPEAMVAQLCVGRSLDLETAAYVARRFRTSLLASARRLVETTEVPCAIAYSQDGVVTWARRSRTYRGYIPTKHRIRPGSIAAEFFSGRALRADPCPVPAAAWGRSVRPDAELVEQSLAYEDPRGVLTLLWTVDD